MKIQKFGIENFSVFEAKRERERMMAHFIWGKKDFRIVLQPTGLRSTDPGSAEPEATLESELPLVQTSSGEWLKTTSLQYMNQFEWYDFGGLVGHGLARDEVRWVKGKQKRYVEVPKDFIETAVEIACREFGLEQKAS